DGFQVATLTTEYRSAAYTELSKMQLKKQHAGQAYEYASRALVYNGENITALQLQYIAARLMGNKQTEEKVKREILQLDPLNHFIRFEAYWKNKNEATKHAFTSLIRDELPRQTYLDLASWYEQLNRPAETEAVLQAAPVKDDEILYWLAWLHRNEVDAPQWLDAAVKGNADMVFPFREASAPVMQWALHQTGDWKPHYYLALIESFHDHKATALHLLEEINTPVNFAQLYVTRARLRDSTDMVNILNDLTTAENIDKKDWRYGKYLAQWLLSHQQYGQALQVIEPCYKNDPGNYITGMLYTRCLVMNDKYDAAEEILDHIHILPYEGATDGHKLYEQTKLTRALQLLQQKQYPGALKKLSEAREWPERLGVGKPYPDMIDDTLENGIAQLIRQAMQGGAVKERDLNAYRAKIAAISETKE
ncbi:MAG TPA: tetratricopeptide repeat protein, partial [Chitinophagaceae bacterium]